MQQKELASDQIETFTSQENPHRVKSVRIRSFSGPYFPAFGIRENTDQKNPEYGHFSRSEQKHLLPSIIKFQKQ